MNHAICLKCGTGKAGALGQCPRCGFQPQDSDDKAKSILLSDRCAKMPLLEKVGRRIASGEKMKFDEADVLKISDALEAVPKVAKKVAGLTVRQWIIFGTAAVAGIAFGFCVAGVKQF